MKLYAGNVRNIWEEIEGLHDLVGIPDETTSIEFVDEAEIAMAIHTLIEVV